MNINGIILEDDRMIASKIENIILSYNPNIQLTIFSDIHSCYEYILNNPVDIAFLDIEIKDETSIQLANELKRPKYSTLIIFISDYPKYAIECIGYRVLNFIEKKDLSSKLLETLNSITYLLEKNDESITIQTNRQSVSLPLKNILYINKEPNHVIFHLVNHIYKQYSTLSSVEEKLPTYFFKIDQGIIINFFHIKQYDYNYVVLDNNEKIIISRRKRKECFNLYHQFCITYDNLL